MEVGGPVLTGVYFPMGCIFPNVDPVMIAEADVTGEDPRNLE